MAGTHKNSSKSNVKTHLKEDLKESKQEIKKIKTGMLKDKELMKSLKSR